MSVPRGRDTNTDDPIPAVEHAAIGMLSIKIFPTTAEDTRWQSAELDDLLYFTGGMVTSWDGAQVWEAGFTWSPSLNVTGITAGGSLDPDVPYFYNAIYQIEDRLGKKHRSASVFRASQQTATPTGANLTIAYTVNFMNLTAREDLFNFFRAPSEIRVYRSVGNPGTPIPYFLLEAIQNDLQVNATTSRNDGAADTALDGEELLYASSELIAEMPPHAVCIAAHKNRLWISDGRTVRYSKPASSDLAAEFSDAFKLVVPEGDDRVTALSSLDEAMVIFKRRQIYVVYGDGPTPSGVPIDGFTEPRLVSSDVGCKDPRSVLRVPQGVIFQSDDDRLKLLDRGLSVQDIGADVEDDLAEHPLIVSADLVTSKTQARFLCNSEAESIILVFDYESGLWSKHKPMGGVIMADAVVRNGVYHLLRQNGVVYKEDDTYDDDGQFYSLRVRSPWVRFGDVQGFKRVWRAGFLGELKQACGVTYRFGYDYDPEFPFEREYEEPAITSLTKGKTGANLGRLQQRIHNPRQKCQAMRVEIESTAPKDGTATRGFTVTALSFEWGRKAGILKQGETAPKAG